MMNYSQMILAFLSCHVSFFPRGCKALGKKKKKNSTKNSFSQDIKRKNTEIGNDTKLHSLILEVLIQ